MVSEASTTTAIYRVGADIGGTFTDVVLIGSDGTLATRKVSSTPESFGRAVIRGVDELLTERGIDRDALDALAHASTVATNAILEQKGAVTALVTTEGFRDVLEMRRLRIPVLYDLQYRKPAPLAPRRLRLEVSECIGPGGAVWKPLDEESVVKAARELRRAGVQSVAVAFLHSYANPVHEHRAAEILRQHLPDGVFIVCSADVLPEIREYERTSTAVVSAYIGPTVEDYLARLQGEMRATGIGAPLQIMQSNGGVMSLEGVRRKPAAIVESGPAAGVIACARLAEALGIANAISFDMGGTTAKSAMIEDGKPSMTTEYEVGAGINLSSKLVKGGGYPIKLPFIDVSEIGSGGGSIVAIDETGALKVGPASAGAAPGPVCYGAGGEQPTFTDAVLTLGYLNQSSPGGGAVRLDAQRSFAVFEDKVARRSACLATMRPSAFHHSGRHDDPRGEGRHDLSRSRPARLRARRLRRQRSRCRCCGGPRTVDPHRADPAGARRVLRARHPHVEGRARVFRQPVPQRARHDRRCVRGVGGVGRGEGARRHGRGGSSAGRGDSQPAGRTSLLGAGL